MATTKNLALTLVEQAQAQKEVTVNAAFIRLDALMNTGAKDKDINTPPVSPTEGDVYIVAAAATGVWAAQSGKIAYFAQTWQFFNPNEGMRLWVADEAAEYVFTAGLWQLFRAHLGARVTSATAVTLGAADSGKQLVLNAASAVALTLPNTLLAGFTATIVQNGAGVVTSSAASGASLNHRLGHTKTAGQFAVAQLRVISNATGTAAVYVLSGDTAL